MPGAAHTLAQWQLLGFFFLFFFLGKDEKVTRNSCDGRRIQRGPPCVTQGAGEGASQLCLTCQLLLLLHTAPLRALGL